VTSANDRFVASQPWVCASAIRRERTDKMSSTPPVPPPITAIWAWPTGFAAAFQQRVQLSEQRPDWLDCDRLHVRAGNRRQRRRDANIDRDEVVGDRSAVDEQNALGGPVEPAGGRLNEARASRCREACEIDVRFGGCVKARDHAGQHA
jgi:hypothetical protein